MILMHSYTYRTYPLKMALRKSIEYGYDGIELQGVHYDTWNFASGLESAISLAKRYNVTIPVVSFGTNLIADDANERKKNIEAWKEAVPSCRKYGVKRINGGVGSLVGDDPHNYGANGSAIAKERHYEMAAEGLCEIAKICEAEEVKITLEIHMNTIHDSALSTLKLLNMVDSPFVLANPDPGNMYATPQAEEATEAIKILKGKIGYFHFKNCRKIGEIYDYSWPLANGALDNYKIVKVLYETGYGGDMCIEYCGLGDPGIAAKEDIIYLRKLIADVLKVS